MSEKTYTYEDVVKGLEWCLNDEEECVGCPFYDEYRLTNCIDIMHSEAIKLLKRLGQENEELEKKLWNGAYCI